MTVTKFSIIKSAAKFFNSYATDSKIKLNQSADDLFNDVLSTGDTELIDQLIADLFLNRHLTDLEINEFKNFPPSIFPKFNKAINPPQVESKEAESSKFGRAYRDSRVKNLENEGKIVKDQTSGKIYKVETQKSKTPFVAYSQSLAEQFKTVGFIQNDGSLITSDLADKVLSELWENYEWPIHYRTQGYLQPITVVTKPQAEKIYLNTAVKRWDDVDPTYRQEIRGYAENVTGGYKIPRVKAEADFPDDVDLSQETPIFTIEGIRYFHSYALKTIYISHPVEYRNAGKIEKHGFKSNIKKPLLRPLLGNDGLILENILDIHFPQFNLTRLGSAARFANRRKSQRKESVKTKISWGTRFIPVVESAKTAISSAVNIPGRKTKDKLVLQPSGVIELHANGRFETVLGHFKPSKGVESCYWNSNIPVSWNSPALNGEGFSLDYTLKTILENESRRMGKIKGDLAVDHLINPKTKIGNLSKRQYQRLKQNARGWAANLTDAQIASYPPSLAASITALWDKATTEKNKATANKNLISWYLKTQENKTKPLNTNNPDIRVWYLSQ